MQLVDWEKTLDRGPQGTRERKSSLSSDITELKPRIIYLNNNRVQSP